MRRTDLSAWLAKIRCMLLQRFGFPELWIQFPRTISRLLMSAKEPAYSMSSFELWTRPYYARIASNFRAIGRNGFAWDEALGVPFGVRIYNNTLTYLIYGWLSPRAFRGLSLSAYLLATLLGGWWSGNWGIAIAVSFVLLGTAVSIHSLFGFMNKPEALWWSVGLAALMAGEIGEWGVALAALGILYLANASLAAILTFLLGPAWLVSGLLNAGLPGGAAVGFLVPGALKIMIRVLMTWRDTFGRSVVAEQKRTAGSGMENLKEYLRVMLWFGLPLLVIAGGLSSLHWLVCVSAFALYFANRHWVKIADTVTINLCFLSVLVSLVVITGSWWGILGLVLFGNFQPFRDLKAIVGLREGRRIEAAMRTEPELRLQALKEIASQFPWLFPNTGPSGESLDRLLEIIPDKARVLIESNGSARGQDPNLIFRNWADSRLSRRQVEFVNLSFLVRMTEPDLAEKYLDRFNGEQLSPWDMRNIAGQLGVSHVIAFTDATIRALTSQGFVPVETFGGAEVETALDVLQMPSPKIVLLRSPEIAGVLSPYCDWERRGNVLSWDAKSGQEYLVRYRFQERFSASQAGREITVVPEIVFPGLALRFMRVVAEIDGPVQLKYRGLRLQTARPAAS